MSAAICDLSASSDVGAEGSVTVQTLGIDPSQGLLELPVSLVDPSRQIAQACGVGVPTTQGSFVVTRRGGVPANATETQGSGAVPIPWVTRSGSASDRAVSLTLPRSSAAIVEAQGLDVDRNGEISLTAQAQPHTPRFPGVACSVLRF